MLEGPCGEPSGDVGQTPHAEALGQWGEADPSVALYALKFIGPGSRCHAHRNTGPAEGTVPRDELVLKAYYPWLANPEAAIALFREHERQHAERLKLYRANRAWLTEQWDHEYRRLDSQWFGSLAAIEPGVLTEQSYIDWCRWVVQQLKRQRQRAERRECPWNRRPSRSKAATSAASR